jgi:AbiV family abortive infection protein
MEAQSKGFESWAEGRQLMAACYEHAGELLNAARKLLEEPATPNIAYHLALLGLEEIGKAGLIGARAVRGGRSSNQWTEKWLGSHIRKLWWALWSPIKEINPANFTGAKQLAERLHSQRLAGLYVDPSTAGVLPSEVISSEEARSLIELVSSRLEAIQNRAEEVEAEPGSIALLEWFLETADDPESVRQLFSQPFLAKYEQFGGDVRRWVEWAKSEFEKFSSEARAAMHRELSRRPGDKGSERLKWRIRTRVYTASHSLRPKILNYWNDRIDIVKLVFTGKNDEFILELMLNDRVLLPDLYGHALGFTKMMLAFLSIGSIGYFWFGKADFTRRVFEEVKDLGQPNFKLDIGPRLSFWDSGRAVALTEQHIQHAIECMSTFMPMAERTAEPIFWPYFQGLALIAKSDVHVGMEAQARQAFVAALRAALRLYGLWDGAEASFRDALDRAFQSIIVEAEHRATVFAALEPAASARPPTLENVITTKQLADLFLIRTARERWQQSLLDWEAQSSA